MTFRSGDMALCTETTVDTIKRYCKQGLLAPAAGNRTNYFNCYDPRQIPLFYMVKALRELGQSHQEFLDYGQNRTPESTERMLREHCERIENAIAALQVKLEMFRSHASLIAEGRSVKPGIELRALPAQPVHRTALKKVDDARKNAEQLRYACGDIRQNGNAGCPLGYAWNDFAGLLENPNQPAQLVSFDPNGLDSRPAGEYLVGTVDCYYGEKLGLPRRMSGYAMQNGLEFHGPAYMVYLLDAVSVMDTEQYLLQIAVEVRHL